MQTILRNLIVTVLFSLACVWGQFQVISQVADGGGWGSTLVATNTTSSDTTATFVFYMDTANGNTQSWTPAFLEGNNTAGLSIPAGSTIFLHTPGTASTVSQGWAQLIANSGVQAYVIYTYKSAGHPNQDATSPAVTPASRILVPFDNTNGLVTALAIVNPNATNLSVSANFKTSTGVVTTGSFPNLPPNGQMAFLFPNQFSSTAGQRGLAEFYSASGTFTVLALRANPTGAFTSAPVYLENGAPIISTGGSGGSGGSGGGSGGGAGDIVDAAFSIGIMNLTQGATTQVSDLVSGAISRFSPSEWNAPFSGTKYGNCIVYDTTFDINGKVPGVGDSTLDAGALLSLSGSGLPSGTTVPSMSTPIGPVYSKSFSPGTLKPGGTYVLTGNGGTQVKAFKTSATLPSNFVVTNWAALHAVNRSQAFTADWTGASGAEIVLSLSSTSFSGTTIHGVYIGCSAPGSDGKLTVPTAALAHLLAVQSGSFTSSGALGIQAVQGATGTSSPFSSNATSFLPDLVAGGKANYGLFGPYIGYEQSVTIQ